MPGCNICLDNKKKAGRVCVGSKCSLRWCNANAKHKKLENAVKGLIKAHANLVKRTNNAKKAEPRYRNMYKAAHNTLVMRSNDNLLSAQFNNVNNAREKMFNAEKRTMGLRRETQIIFHKLFTAIQAHRNFLRPFATNKGYHVL